jgi:hypothetical protein
MYCLLPYFKNKKRRNVNMGIYQGENLLASTKLATVSGVDTFDATATSAQILIGQTAYVDGQKITGTMPNQGAKTATLDAGNSYTIPKGYHDGTGKVSAKDLASQTDGTATKMDISAGKTAYVDGVKVIGTLGEFTTTAPYVATSVSKEDSNIKLSRSVETEIILRSGLNLSMSAPLSNLGNATAADVAAGKTFTSTAGLKVTGSGKALIACTLTGVAEGFATANTVRSFSESTENMVLKDSSGNVIQVEVNDVILFPSATSPNKLVGYFRIKNVTTSQISMDGLFFGSNSFSSSNIYNCYLWKTNA